MTRPAVLGVPGDCSRLDPGHVIPGRSAVTADTGIGLCLVGTHPMLHQQPSWARPTGGNEDRLPRTRGVTGHSGWGLSPAGRSRTDRILDISPREPIDFQSVNDRVAPLVVE